MHGFGWSWRIFPRNSRRFGFRRRGGKAVVTAGGCEAKPCPAFSPVPAFHPVAKFERLWCVFVRKGSEVGVVLFFFFQGFWGGLYNLDAMPAACGRSRRAGWDPAGSGY